ncbi:MAG: caspase family protein [Candidatus Eremiobacteraeota bacterium]|nr:caspase family protein [Candidatus Eremiobacteraeota bacterium]
MKSALLVGIRDYPGMDPIPGCLNDAADVEVALRRLGFTSIIRLPDDPAHWQQVTGARIKDGLRAAIAALRSGDEFMFYFSGHGVKYPVHGVDHEGLCGVDFAWPDPTSVLIDDDLSQALAGLADGARVTIVADACYSGGLQTNFALLLSTAAAPSFRIRAYPVIPDDIMAEIARLDSLQQTRTFADAVMAGNGVPTTRNAVLLSACAPDQLAADTDFAGRPNGVLTFALLQRLAEPGAKGEDAKTTLAALTAAIKAFGFSQTPQLHGREILFGEPLIP